MDAVVIVNGARLQRPYNDEMEAGRKTFGQKYFAAGKVYRLIFGGGDAGTVKVNNWDLGCNNIHAKVTIRTWPTNVSVRIPRNVAFRQRRRSPLVSSESDRQLIWFHN